MKILHLINETYQIVDQTDTIILQGTYDECLGYMAKQLIDKIVNTPELLNVFKRLADK